MQIGQLHDVFRDLFLVRYTSIIVLGVGKVNKLDQAKKGLVSTYRHSLVTEVRQLEFPLYLKYPYPAKTVTFSKITQLEPDFIDLQRARLQTTKPDMAHVASCRKIISIELTASAVLIVFQGQFCFQLDSGRILQGLVLKIYNFIEFTNFQHTE